MKFSTKICRPAGARSGMTLIEMVFSVAIGVVIMGVAIALIIFSARTFLALSNYDDLTRKSRFALDRLSADIRTSQRLFSFASNSTMQQIVLTNMPGSSSSIVTYTYARTNGTITRTLGGLDTVLVSNIDSLNFVMSTRSPSNNFQFYPTTNPAATKLINVSWKCSRPFWGTAMINSDSIQDAKIVIRN